MKLVLFHNPRCSKSRAALALLQAAGHRPEVVNYLKTPYNVARLHEICKKAGLTPRCLLRKGEALYKELGLNAQTPDEECLRLMAEYPILVQRPILLAGEKAVIGRPPENMTSILPPILS